MGQLESESGVDGQRLDAKAQEDRVESSVTSQAAKAFCKRMILVTITTWSWTF